MFQMGGLTTTETSVILDELDFYIVATSYGGSSLKICVQEGPCWEPWK